MDGAEKTFRRGFLDCGLFLILEASRADITSNRDIGKNRHARKGLPPADTVCSSKVSPPGNHAKALSPGRMPCAELPIRPAYAFHRWAWFPPLSPHPAGAQRNMFMECLP